jgi:ribosome-associated protein
MAEAYLLESRELEDIKMTSHLQSRTQKKREAKSVETLAKALADLSPHEIGLLPVDSAVREEIFKAKTMVSHGARRRQIKLLSKMLRDRELSPLIRFMDEKKGTALAETRLFHRLERIRNLIIDEEQSQSGLEEAARLFSDLDIHLVASLAQHYRVTGNRRYAREIFRMLKAAHERQRWKEQQTMESEQGGKHEPGEAKL